MSANNAGEQLACTFSCWRLLVAMAVGAGLLDQLALRAAAEPMPTSPTPVVSLLVGSATGEPGEQVSIAVTLRTAGFEVAGVQNDITFFPRTALLVDCAVNPDLGKDLTQFSISYSGMRAIVLGNNVDAIPDAAILYSCAFNIAAGATPGDASLIVSRVVASSPTGERLPAVGTNGVIVVPDTRPTRTPTATPTPVRPAIVLDFLRGFAGDRVPVRTYLQSAGAVVVGTQNDITFDSRNVPVAAQVDGRPDCFVNPEIDKAAASFAFVPAGCSGTACTSVRAVVLSTANNDPIPDGSMLYTCFLDIAAAAPAGKYPLSVSGVVLSDPLGQRVPDTAGGDGSIFVLPPVPPTPAPRPAIILSSISVNPGEQATIMVTATLMTVGTAVAGAQNDITFDSVNAPIAAKANGKPDCTVNPDVDKAATSFAFRPPGCSGESCTTVRALVLSTDNSDPIPDGLVLYACKVTIAATAPAAVYPLSISEVVLSTPDGQQVPGATGTDGVVLVGSVEDGHKPHKPQAGVPTQATTATATPTAAPPLPPAGPQPTATATARVRTGAGPGATTAFREGDGCRIDTSGDRGTALIVLLPALTAVRMRRRRRRRTRTAGLLPPVQLPARRSEVALQGRSRRTRRREL